MDYNYILEQCQHGNEIWKDILGYEGKYQVSNMGRVKSLDRSVIDKNCKRLWSWTICNICNQ